LDFFARVELVNDVVNKIQQLANQIDHRHFLILAKVDHLALQTITHGSPFVFLNQHPAIQPEAEIPVHQLIELGDDCLEQRRNGDRVVDASRNVTDAKLEGWKERMRAAVPPNLFAVIDTAGLYQQINIAFKCWIRFK